MGEFTALLQIEHGIIQAPMAGGAVTAMTCHALFHNMAVSAT